MNLHEKLIAIQNELKAPKNQYNSFAKYKYRSAEDLSLIHISEPTRPY